MGKMKGLTEAFADFTRDDLLMEIYDMEQEILLANRCVDRYAKDLARTEVALEEALDMIELAVEQAHEEGVDCEQMVAFVDRVRQRFSEEGRE